MKFYYILLTSLSCLLTSCITIEETYTFKEDGSGNCTFKIDLSEMKNMMNTAGKPEAEPSLQAVSFEEEKKSLATIKGISNTEIKTDKEKYVFEISYQFDSQDALNKATNVLLESTDYNYFDYQKKAFSLNHPLPQAFIDTAKEIENEEMKDLFSKVEYKIVLNFDQTIKKVTSEAQTTTSNDAHQITIQSNFAELLQKPNNMATNLKLK